MNQAFSKIWIIVIVVIFVVGGILTWQFWLKEVTLPPVEITPELNLKTTKLATIPENYEVGDIVFSPDGKQVAYTATEGEKKFIVLNNKKGKRYDWAGDLTFSPDSKQFAYRAKEGRKEFVIFNNKEGKRHDKVWIPTFSPDSKYLAYGAQYGNQLWWIVEPMGR